MIIDRIELTKLAIALGGLPVLTCRAGSAAERAGVRYGDIVLEVNGIETPDWASFLEARRKTTGVMTLHIFRDGVYFALDVDLAGSMTPRPHADVDDN
ncbi:MAG TPA: PDZ domain-containing protein [Kofleriaceae bacterium]|nr:PDZ domain-containing protein [Kofleriaceae bacterium]